MGLDISHDTWRGAYSAFHRWRAKIAELMELPPLDLMQGFYQKDEDGGDMFIFMKYKDEGEIIGGWRINKLREQLPIKWDCLKENPVHELLHHSDCDGEIEWQNLESIANELEKILPQMKDMDGGGHIGNYYDKTSQFIKGCREAYKKKENLDFH